MASDKDRKIFYVAADSIWAVAWSAYLAVVFMGWWWPEPKPSMTFREYEWQLAVLVMVGVVMLSIHVLVKRASWKIIRPADMPGWVKAIDWCTNVLPLVVWLFIGVFGFGAKEYRPIQYVVLFIGFVGVMYDIVGTVKQLKQGRSADTKPSAKPAT